MPTIHYNFFQISYSIIVCVCLSNYICFPLLTFPTHYSSPSLHATFPFLLFIPHSFHFFFLLYLTFNLLYLFSSLFKLSVSLFLLSYNWAALTKYFWPHPRRKFERKLTCLTWERERDRVQRLTAYPLCLIVSESCSCITEVEIRQSTQVFDSDQVQETLYSVSQLLCNNYG